MQIRSASYLTSATSLEECPPESVPEFAFVGRSNVGKSSLINMLARQRKQLAEVSSRPGRTQMINFFLMNQQWHLVDLPGYGYAKTSADQQRKFQEFVTDYLINRGSLTCVFVLIDSKIPPQQIDLDFTEWLIECGVPFVLAFTKADKSKPGAVQRNVEAFLDGMCGFCDLMPRYFICSSVKGDGRKEVLHFIDQALSNTKDSE